ncbi:trans-aconitate 2-methyltransferase [uncultured Pseudonocardia sp.]|uniref:class I SAM-dependent methyltransferase n=2 Tax=Pseudonocardia TaxID=1847 RepID=UPI00262CF8FC|nr:class I SAM-dependent methyltransferase [uncultured Pseudonocardia sp.]
MTHGHGHQTGTAEAVPGSPQFWEEFYRARPQVFSGRVNPILAQTAEHLRPGTALDLGAGEGADTAWLAEHGWAVTAVDVSTTALDRVLERNSDVTVERHDLTATFPAGTFDLVNAQYLQSPDEAFPREAILRRATAAVAPGGTLLIVGHGGHATNHAPQPTAHDVLTALAIDSATWDVDRCETVPRVVTRPDGTEVSVPDEVTQVRRVLV